MNEQAIIDSYNLAVQNGYKKSIGDFKQLISSNQNALGDIYNIAVQNGYKKSIDDYKVLMGVGATVERPMAERPVAAQPEKKNVTESPSVGGGLEPAKSDGLGSLAVKVQDERILNKKPREAKPIVSGESTKVVSPKGLQKEEVSTELDKNLEEFQASQKKGGKSYLENIAVNLGLGASYANEAVLSIPESIVNILAIPQNYIAEKTGLPIGVTAEGIKESWGITNPLLDYAKEGQKVLGGEVSKFMADRYEDPSIVGNFEKGNYKEGFELLGSAITQSVPVSIGLMIGGAYTAPSKLATVATLGFTEDQRESLAEMDPTMSEAEKTLKAVGMAGAESVFSSIGTATIGKVYRDIAKREGTEAAKGIFRDGLVQTYKKALEKFGVAAGFAGEGIEEAATQITQNVISGRPAFEGAADAFVTGAGSGVVFTAPISAVNAKRYIENKVTSYNTKSKVTEILKDKADNMAQVYNVPVSSEINVTQLEIANLPNSRDLLVNNLKKSVSDGQITEEDAKQSLFVFDKVQQVSNSVKDLDISVDDKAKVASLLRQRDDLRTKIQNKDDVLVVQEKRQIEEINNQIQSIISTPKSTYKVDGKDVSVDAIDELIKTKSKDELLAMNIEINNDQTGLTERLQSVLETKPVEQDAIQEQAAGEVPVQPGATVSEEVAQGEPQAEPQVVAEEGQVQEVVDPLKDVESTTNALANGIIDTDGIFTDRDSFNTIYDIVREGDLFSDVREKARKEGGGIPQRAIAEKYHESKANGTNPDFVQLVENAFIQQTPTQQEAIPASIQPEIDTIEDQRRQELEANKAGLDSPYYLGETEGPTLGEVINQQYDARINELRAKAAPQQVQGEVISQEEIDLETQLAEDLKTIKGTTQPRLRVEGIDIPAEEDINIETIEDNLDKLPVYEAKFTTPTVSQDIQVNPIEESKSSTKEGTAESRTIESFDGIPMIVGMSDTLSAGTVTDALGNPMETEGGLLYNVLGKNKNAAWAGVTKKGANVQYQEALEVYNNNKDLFEKLWAEGKLPNGHVPMAIMRMADTAVNSNEAVFRYLSPLVKSQPEANQQAALDALKGDIQVKKNVKQKATVKSAKKLDEFISNNNISSLGQLLDAIISDANSRAKGDTKNTLSLTERSLLFDLMISPQKTKEASKNTVNALFGSKKDPRSKAFLADTIYNDIAEPSMMKTPKGNIVAVVGIDVLNGGVIPVEHGNYGFGPKGQMIALISNPKHGLDVFPEWKAKATRVFKGNKKGEIPSDQKVADEVGGAFFIDKAFRNARVAINPSDVELLAAKLRFAFPDVTVSRTQEEFDNVLNQEGVRTQKSGGVTILGLTKDGKVYLNPNSDSLATPIHEFGHVWIDFLRSKASGKKGDALLAKGLSLVEGTNALKKAIEKYGDNPIAREEALVELMANKGETIINKSKKKQFTNWLNSLFKYVKEFFTTSEQFFKGTDFEQRLKEITLDDFINIGLADLLKGKAVSSKFKAKDAGKGTVRESRTQRLAPNGKPSNLNEAQWNQVRTPEFKKWFGDWENDPENASKVVDENGEPLVMYHGSISADIESFDPKNSQRVSSGLREYATYFTSNERLAELYRKAPMKSEAKDKILAEISKARKLRIESRSNSQWDFYTKEIERLESLLNGRIYEVFLNVKSPFEFDGGGLDQKGWKNANLNIGYKTVSGQGDLMEALTNNNSAFKNDQFDGVIATNLADSFYGTTNIEETIKNVKDLVGTVVAIWDPKQIKSATENIGTFDAETSNIRFRIGDNITSFISKARAQGFSEAAIKNVLTRSGVDTDSIDTALGKVEVTEKLPANYERMIGELEGVIEKSLNRNKDKENAMDIAMQNAINYLQGTKVYEEANDVQREAMFRDVRKRFKKREKSAPSADKIVGKPKKQVTVDEMAALKDQIKLEARAAREAKGDLNKKRKALAARIIEVRRRGAITAAQARALVNRISKVNLDNPIMVDRLIEYTDKVFDNANYAADMADLRKLQRQARTKKHTSMKDFVDRFTYINPELIPLDRIQDYKEALDFLNNRTPSYSRMNEMLPEIESYQVSEEFDSVKTIEGLNNKYESIALNEVNNVEEYVNLIKDINSFKRKAFQLLQNEAITQEEYDNLIDMVGKDQAEIEKRYEKQISQLKSDLITEIKTQRPKTNPELTKEENDLIKEYLELSDADLQSLSPEDLFILNDLLENISNGEIDYYRFKNVVSKAANNKAGVEVGKQLKGSKLSLGSAKLREEMAKFESAFWEGLLGLGRATSGPLQKFIISPFNRAIGSYEKFIREGFNDFLKLKKKYKIDDSKLFKSTKQMSKIGMLTTYLQEYMAQFDPKNNGVKDIGKRDWFKEILASETMRDDYSPEELKIIEEIHKSLPKDKDGNVNPKAVYDSYIANDGKFFTKNEKGFFDAVMDWKKNNSTSKQKAANEMSGNAFKEIPFHMLRSRYSGQTSQITPATSGDNGMVRIKAGTGKERASEAVGAINTNFEKLFIKGLEQTGRDYFLSKTLKDINNVLASAKKELAGDKDPLVKAISYTLSDALAYEFSDTASQNLLKRLVQARAAMTLFDPIRAGVEFTSTLLSFGLRARTLSGYKNLFGSQGDMRNLLEFTDSPLRLRQNINNAIDINDGRIEPQGMLMKWTTFLSGLPERTMMVTSWMPTFTNEFQNITKEKFDMKKFNDSSAYREKYGKAIKEASAVADAQTEKIIGPTTKAGQRREIAIFPGKTVGRDTVSGQILGFFSNYPYREVTEFVNGFREAGEVLKKGDTLDALSQLQKPLGISLNVAAYGFLSSVVYASRLILLGDDDEEERGEQLLEELMTSKGFIEETSANAAALAASKYAGGGRATLQLLGTLGMMMTDDEETKATIKKMLKGSVYVDPLPTQKLSGYGTADKVNTAIVKYIPQFVVLSNIIIDGMGGLNELKAIYDKVDSKGIDALTKDEELKVLALSVVFTGTQLFLNYRGTSLPSYNNLKAGMKTVKEEAGVADISSGKVPAKKSSGGGGGAKTKPINKTDLKRYFPEQYNQLYGPGSPGYEIQQQVKEFEKQQRELEKSMKDKIYGVKD